MKPSSIKPHRKSRTGCKTCKMRKIRCDEHKPSCINCNRHSVRCDFTDAPSSIPRTSSPNAHLSALGSQDVAPVLSSQADARISGSTGPAAHEELKMLELELMHNYSTSTSYTISENPILSSLLRLTVPQLSLEHPFLMRTLLALSALHIAHHSPSRRDHLVSYAIAQHRSASQAAGILLANVTADNCVPVYIFSILTYVFAMATPSQPGDDLLLLNDAGVADWIYLLRGTKEIVVLNYIYIAASPFGPMFAAGARRHCLRTTDTSPHQPLSTLLSFLRNNANSDISAAESAERMVIYESTIEELRKTFSVINKAASAGDLQVTDISIWVFNTSDEYLALLRDKDNVALVIMSYFCVLLKKLEAHWWMAGRATHILGSIYRLVDAEYRLLMWWPMEELGWLPPGSGEVSRRSSKEYAPWHGRTA